MSKKRKQQHTVNARVAHKPWSPPLWLLAVCVGVLTFITLYPVLGNGFINWDDNAYVFENKYLSESFGTAISYFFGPHYFIGNYIPVTMTVYWLEFNLFGQDAGVFHLVNLLLHVLNTLLVFRFACALSNKERIVAVLTAVLFGIHPMHVESVAWVAELKDVLYTCFFLCGLLVYQRHIEASGTKRLKMWFVVFMLFGLSVLSKPSAVVFPVVLLLLDAWYKRPLKQSLLEKVPLLLISILMGMVAIEAQQANNLLFEDYPFYQRLLFAAHSFVWYIVKAFAPIGLSIFHPYPVSPGSALSFWYYLVPIAIVLLVIVAYRLRHQYRALAFGLAFYTVNILLVLQIVGAGFAKVAERYTYVSYIGIFFGVSMAGVALYRKYGTQVSILPGVLRVVTALVILLFSMQTYSRCKVWQNDETVAVDLAAKYPDDWLALNNLGFIRQMQRRYPEAVGLFRRALDSRPSYTMASINLVNTYLSMDNTEDAQNVTDAALQFDSANHHLLNLKGYILAATGKPRDAIQAYEQSIQADVNDIDVYIRLSECYFALKEYQTGIAVVDRALQIQPNNHVLLNNKGYFLYTMGKYQEAARSLRASLEQQPQYDLALANLQNCYNALVRQRDSLGK